MAPTLPTDASVKIGVSNAAAPLTFHQLLDDPSLAANDLQRVDSLPLSLSIHQTYIGLRGDASKLGLTFDGSGFGMGTRAQRFALIAKDGVVSHVNVEEPGAFDVSSAEYVLKQLNG